MADFTDQIDDLKTSITNFSNYKLNAKSGVASGLKYSIKVLTTTTGTVSIDLSEAQVYLIEPTDDISFEFTNLPAANEYITSIIRIKNGGLHVVTWPTGSLFEEGTPPVLTNSGEDIISIQYDLASSKFWITNVKSNWQTT